MGDFSNAVLYGTESK